MRLNPKEQEKLMLHMAGNLAKERRAVSYTHLTLPTKRIV